MTTLELANAAIHEQCGPIRRLLLKNVSDETKRQVASEVTLMLPESQKGFSENNSKLVIHLCKTRCLQNYVLSGSGYGLSIWLWLIGILIEALIRWWLSRNLQNVRAQIINNLRNGLER